MLITEENYGMMLTACEASDLVAIDTETTGLDVRNGRDYLMGICLSVGDFGGYLPFRHPTGNLPWHVLDWLVNILAKKNLTWHNRKFDFHSLATLGVDPTSWTGKHYCTMVLASLMNEELYSKELDALAKLLLGEQKFKKDEINKWGDILGRENLPPEMNAEYGTQDAHLHYRLWEYIWPRILEQGLENVWWDTELPFNTLLYKMERRGVGVNRDFCTRKAEQGTERLEVIRGRLAFNPGSSQQLGRYLLDELGLPVLKHTKSCDRCKNYEPVYTHDGPASFDKTAMEEYDEILQASNNPTAKLISEYRGWQKAVSSLYLPMLEKAGPDGRVRTEFHQHRTVTGRLSSSGPNLQQIPRGSDHPWNGNAKSAFHAGVPGFRLLGWDYSQLELRIASAYGKERLLLNEFNDETKKADPFSVLAPRIFGELTPDTRQWTKTFVYANLYGAGIQRIAATLNRPVEEVEELYANYHESIPGIMRVAKQVDHLVKKRGYVKYWDGRRRHIRDRRASYKAWNSVNQGGAAQLVKRAQLKCEEFEDEHCEMRLQVHDEIGFAIEEGMEARYEKLITEAMTDFNMGVRLVVEGKEWK